MTNFQDARKFVVYRLGIYKAYHLDLKNRIIHAVFAPVLYYGFILLFGLFPLKTGFFLFDLFFGLGWLLTAVFCLAYYLVDPLVASGLLAAFTILGGIANSYISSHYALNALLWSLTLIGVAGFFQLGVGHFCFEGKAAPGSFAFYHISLLPFAVVMNGLNEFGYRPSLKKEIHSYAEKYSNEKISKKK